MKNDASGHSYLRILTSLFLFLLLVLVELSLTVMWKVMNRNSWIVQMIKAPTPICRVRHQVLNPIYCLLMLLKE